MKGSCRWQFRRGWKGLCLLLREQADGDLSIHSFLTSLLPSTASQLGPDAEPLSICTDSPVRPRREREWML